MTVHALKTGIAGKNWDEVSDVLEGFHPSDFKKSKTLVPVSIPAPPALKKAFTTPWNPQCGMPFALWVTGLLAAWCWSIWGCRSGCDIKSLKDADQHTLNLAQGWASTSYKNGRNKLSGKKRNSRSWNA